MTENPRWPHSCRIVRETEPTDPFADSGEESRVRKVVYEGMCRNYSKTVTSDSGKVVTSTRVLSIPRSTMEWTDCPKTGDMVEVEAGANREQGYVKDFRPNNFGTDIYWSYGRS